MKPRCGCAFHLYGYETLAGPDGQVRPADWQLVRAGTDEDTILWGTVRLVAGVETDGDIDDFSLAPCGPTMAQVRLIIAALRAEQEQG